jgi:hypothetical protein
MPRQTTETAAILATNLPGRLFSSKQTLPSNARTPRRRRIQMFALAKIIPGENSFGHAYEAISPAQEQKSPVGEHADTSTRRPVPGRVFVMLLDGVQIPADLLLHKTIEEPGGSPGMRDVRSRAFS